MKDGWPSLTAADARQAIRLFTGRYGGGTIKLFGGEPLLVPEVVRAAMDEAERDPKIDRIYLSTNGLGLSVGWLERIRASQKTVLTISLDGRPEDHRALRRANPGVPDAFAHVMSLREELLRTPRVVITQTIAPKMAKRAAENFAYLRSLGFWRFNLLPGYYIRWRSAQLQDLRAGFDGIRTQIVSAWEAGERLYLRNLFVRAPTPFFNTGLVVDSDRSIHPSNVGLSGQLDALRGRTQVGTLDDPPDVGLLQRRSDEISGLLKSSLSPEVWSSTSKVDAELTRLCRALYRPYFEQRRAS